MTGNKLAIAIIAAAVLAAVFLAGCSSPTPTPAPTATPTVPPAISPLPTPTPNAGGDQANIRFTYIERQYTTLYDGIPVGPGEIMFAFDVTVDSDRPVHTDKSWFTIEYKKNESAPIETYEPMTVVDYPSTTIGNGAPAAKGRVLIVLPEPQGGSIGPTPVYGKPVDQQSGPYKVSGKVYGTILTN